MKAKAEEDPFAGTEPLGGVDYGKFEFRVKRWVLLHLVDYVLPVVPSAAALPVLGCFRVRVTESYLQLAATDMERTILASSQAVDCKEAAENGYLQTYIPARKLQAILREAPDGEITVSVLKNEAVVTSEHGSWTLRLPDGSTYPELFAEDAGDWFRKYSRSDFLEGLKAVRHCVCKDAGRPSLTQVSIVDAPMGEGETVVTASDGIRLARAVLPGFPLALCIPASALSDLMKLLAASTADEIGVGETGAAVVFQVGPVVLAVSRRMASWPDMDRLLLNPAMDNNKDILAVDRDSLAGAVRRVCINADTETSAILLRLSGDEITVVSRDKAGNAAEDRLAASWGGTSRTLCVNHQFLTEMLAAYAGESCEFKLGKDAGKRRSMVLLSSDTGTQVIAQMPPALVGYK